MRVKIFSSCFSLQYSVCRIADVFLFFSSSTLNSMEKFVFENLEVWIQAVDFADIVLSLSERVFDKKHFRLAEQLEAACTSVSMNIAEGAGRNSVKERIQFLHYSRGSLNETITLITILRKRTWISTEEYQVIYNKASSISRMLYAYIRHLRQN